MHPGDAFLGEEENRARLAAHQVFVSWDVEMWRTIARGGAYVQFDSFHPIIRRCHFYMPPPIELPVHESNGETS